VLIAQGPARSPRPGPAGSGARGAGEPGTRRERAAARP
jgi:hypothetical protein